MSPISYNLTSLILGLVIACVIILLVRKDRLHTRYSLWWLMIALGSIVLGAFPRLIDRIAVILGVHYPPVLLIVAGIGLILIKMLTMDIDRSEQERKLRILVQRLAVFEGEKPEEPEKEEKTS